MVHVVTWCGISLLGMGSMLMGAGECATESRHTLDPAAEGAIVVGAPFIESHEPSATSPAPAEVGWPDSWAGLRKHVVRVFGTPRSWEFAEMLSVALSPDGQRIVSGSESGALKLWDAETGRELRTFGGHTGRVFCVGLNSDGGWILSGGEDSTVELWDAETGQELRELAGHSGGVLAVAFSPDSRRILSGSGDHTVKLWDAKAGRELRELTGHSEGVRSVAFSPDGRRIVSGSDDYTVKLWDSETGRELLTLSREKVKYPRLNPPSVAFSSDGRRIVSASVGDNILKLWDAETGRCLRSLAIPTTPDGVGFHPDGKHVLTANGNGTVILWPLEP